MAMARHIWNKTMLKERAQATKPNLVQHKKLPCTCASSPWAKAHSPEPMQRCNMGMQQRAKTYSLYPGRLDRLSWTVRLPLCDLTAWGTVRPPHETGPAPNFSKTARTTLNTFQMLPGAQIKHKLIPLVDNAWVKACKKFQHIASQIYKIHHKMLHMSKWAS
jgi:hypothetical protein